MDPKSLGQGLEERWLWRVPSPDDLLSPEAIERARRHPASQGSRDIDDLVVPAPTEIVEGYHFTTLISDISLMQDRLVHPPDDTPLAASHIHVVSDTQDGRVLRAYRESLKFLASGTTDSGQDPIVSHRQLYERFNFVTAPLRVATASPAVDEDTCTTLTYRHVDAFPWEYESGSSSSRIDDQVNLLAVKFADTMLASDVPLDVRRQYDGAILLVVPFFRPEGNPRLSGGERTRSIYERLVPSGACFLIIRDTADAPYAPLALRLRALSLDLQQDLHQATMDRSFSHVGLLNEQLRYTESYAHAMKAAVQATGHEDTYRRLRTARANANDPDLADVLRRATLSLSLFRLAESLSQMTRLAALHSRGDYAKFLQTVHPDLFEGWFAKRDRIVLDPLASTLEVLAGTMAAASAWADVELSVFDVAGIELACESIRIEDAGLLPIEQLCVPPFKPDSDPVYACLPLMLEPLHNALTYLQKNRRDPSIRGSRLLIHVRSRLPEAIVISVGNAHVGDRGAGMQPVGERLVLPESEHPSGLRTASDMGRLLGVGSILPPSLEFRDARVPYWWVDVHLTPHRLAKQIIQAEAS